MKETISILLSGGTCLLLTWVEVSHYYDIRRREREAVARRRRWEREHRRAQRMEWEYRKRKLWREYTGM